ncbi:rubredoxin [Oscillospiraceae bacterium LTW-04]|nr:rubredoxin [Oscillospiraceae bacterium MB24-C1]
MSKYVCTVCGYTYDEATGAPDTGIAPGTKWEDVPEDWQCPICGAPKSVFEPQQVEAPEAPAPANAPTVPIETEALRELTVGELSALCSNLARGCEKQYLAEESALFTQLADYFKARTPAEPESDSAALLALVQKDLESGFPAANAAADQKPDRGALRALVWSEKVSRILNALLARYEKEGDGFLTTTNVYICEICGFVYVGETPPELCPVCKVPSWKIAKVERR